MLLRAHSTMEKSVWSAILHMRPKVGHDLGLNLWLIWLALEQLHDQVREAGRRACLVGIDVGVAHDRLRRQGGGMMVVVVVVVVTRVVARVVAQWEALGCGRVDVLDGRGDDVYAPPGPPPPVRKVGFGVRVGLSGDVETSPPPPPRGFVYSSRSNPGRMRSSDIILLIQSGKETGKHRCKPSSSVALLSQLFNRVNCSYLLVSRLKMILCEGFSELWSCVKRKSLEPAASLHWREELQLQQQDEGQEALPVLIRLHFSFVKNMSIMDVFFSGMEGALGDRTQDEGALVDWAQDEGALGGHGEHGSAFAPTGHGVQVSAFAPTGHRVQGSAFRRRVPGN
ncbi:hypothetical protein EYF80_027732 [Liparis tanakae]|uniref:Uncharacterized protein n=1 Tax=Liparis tanakae TaxID=230148 RepID=A0A4Z2H8X7_9TELE|nr:hypothetical protein EYF80_027732 [Liparis tanakae]